MGRRHLPVDPQQPLADFAGGLLGVKADSKLTYRQMARKANFCVSVLSEAAAGKRLPTLEVTLAYVSACGEAVDGWEQRWRQARDQLRDAGLGDTDA